MEGNEAMSVTQNGMINDKWPKEHIILLNEEKTREAAGLQRFTLAQNTARSDVKCLKSLMQYTVSFLSGVCAGTVWLSFYVGVFVI